MSKGSDRRHFLKGVTLLAAGMALPGFSNAFSAGQVPKGKRVGVIGLDTSHSVAFTSLLNAPDAPAEYAGFRVVAAYPQGSRDIASSVKMIPGYITKMQEMGIRIVDSVEQLLAACDVVLLETNDGRIHLEQALPVIHARKTVFIDKPITASAREAEAIFAAANKYKVPVFSSSALRFTKGIEAFRDGRYGKVLGAETYSPCYLEPTHPDLYWYGIHGVEMLYTVMGAGCRRLSRMHTQDTDLVVGEWEDGRIDCFRGMRSGPADFGGIVFTEKGTMAAGKFEGYQLLVGAIARFFETGVAPVSQQETLEICRFMDAADESKRKGGATVPV